MGLAPAWQASRRDINESLKKSGARGAEGTGSSSLRLFVISEVALALVLLIGAGLMLKTFARLQRIDPGFDSKNVITMNIALPRQKYSDAQHANLFFAQLFQRIRALPGIESAGGIDPLPLSNNNGTTGFVIEGRPMLATADRPEADQRVITGNYFGTMRIPILKGRAFTEQDRQETPRRIIINETFAHRYWPQGDGMGKRLGFDDGPNQNWWEIVGVVGNVKHESLNAQAKPEVYFSYEQSPNNFMTLVARTSSDPANMITTLRTQIMALDPDQPVFDVKTMEQRLAISVAKTQFVMLLLSIFSILALLLAAIGIYGVMAYAVTQRTREIGIRLALGAQTRDVLSIVLGQGMTLSVIGVAIGLGVALGVTRVMATLLYGVTATDALTFVSVSLLLLGVALLACSIPAWRASKVNPLEALRHE
jgi:putative ABC transport system permease protein